jgi:hypothetical protein
VLAQPVLKNIPDGTRITKGKKITRIFICEHGGIFTNANACILSIGVQLELCLNQSDITTWSNKFW